MKKLIVWILVLCLATFGFSEVLAQGLSPREEQRAIDKQAEVIAEILRLYDLFALERPADLSKCVQEMIAMRRLGQCRDRFSRYVSPEEIAANIEDSVKGEFSGVGLEVTERDGFVTVVTPKKNSPAEKAGIKPEDIIVEVDGKEVKGLNDAVRKIRGPKSTKVKITILRNGVQEPLVFEIVRETILLKPVESEEKIYNRQKIAVIKTNSFTDKTRGQFKAKVLFHKKQGINSFVLDFRNNPGGLFTSALEMLALFMRPEDIALAYKTRSDETTYNRMRIARETKTVSFGEFLNLNAVILINKGSASASELFAGAMKDWEYKIVGERSFGKGTGQTRYPLPDGSEFWLTDFEFLVGNSKTPIRDTGVAPNVFVENSSDKLGEDSQLKKAMDILTGIK